MSIRAFLHLRQVAAAAGICLILTLTGCAVEGPPAVDGDGPLFARGLDEIANLYIQPVSSRQVALAGAAQLFRLDDKLSLTGGAGAETAAALVVGYDGREIGRYALPEDTNSRGWGKLIADLVGTAKQASPRLAALTSDTIDKVVFDGMTASLDRFSHYSPPKMARAQRAARDGVGGIGVALDTAADDFRVATVVPDGPAGRAGVHPEDQIVAIDGVATIGHSHEEIAHQLRGPVGSPVVVSVLRPGSVQPESLGLHRALVTVPTVIALRDGDIGVFRITGFNQNTTQRVSDELVEMQRQAGGRLAGIILDLRNNPGGLLDQAVSLANLFMANGPIVSTTGRHPASHQYFAATGDSIAPSLPIVVLINGGSASAAEILAAAFQDAGRAVVVGSSSYGKGTVQTVLRLPNDGELTLTWAWLIAPSGYYLQSHGVVPTLCTGDLGGDEHAVEAGLQRVSAASVAEPSARPRAALDERGWTELRRLCPARRAKPGIDLKLAERMLADPKLYAATLQALPASTRLTGLTPAEKRPEPSLTDLKPALSSQAQ